MAQARSSCHHWREFAFRSAAHGSGAAGLNRGFIFEGLREVYRRALKNNDNKTAMQAFSMLLEMAAERRDDRIEQLEDEIVRLLAEVNSAEQLLFDETPLA